MQARGRKRRRRGEGGGKVRGGEMQYKAVEI